MQKYKHFPIIALFILILSLLFASNSFATDVSGYNIVIDTTTYGDYSAGTTNGSGNVYENTITINGSARYVYAGVTSGNGNVSDNRVVINGTIASATGGWAKGDGHAIGNSIEVIGTANYYVYAGSADGNGNVIDNRVEISGKATYVYGGVSKGNGMVSNNTVIVKNGGEANTIYAGFNNNTSSIGMVSQNTIIINGGKVNNIIYGGASKGTGNVIDNKVIVENGSTVKNVYGGYNDTSNSTSMVASNKVEINSSLVVGDVYGGYANGDADVNGNSVEISGTVIEDVYGGYANGDGDVIDNSIAISGTASYVYGGYGDGDGDVTDNKVNISGTVMAVYGGQIGDSTGTGTVSDNFVTVSGSALDVFGGLTDGSGDVTGNTVTISGNVNNVSGGYSTNTGNVIGNTVTISGTIFNEVYGGFAASSGTVDNNTVNITSTAILTTNTALWGYNPGAQGSNNTLNVDRFNGTIDTMGNFETYNFVLGQLDSNKTFINIDGAAVNIDGSTINISFTPTFFQDNNISANNVITVISKITNPSSPTVNVDSSPFLFYNFVTVYDYGALQLIANSTLSGPITLQPQTSFVGEGFAAGLAFLGQAADVRSSLYFVPQGPRFIPFAKMIYGKQYISTGSSVNVKGFSAIAGLALNTNFDNGSQLVVGAFVEGGWGDYDSRHSFSNSSVNGKGDTEYYGGGVLARYALKSGLYSEGTFAAGKTETDFRTYDYVPGTRSKYDYSVPYYSAHVAVGQILNLTEMLNLDVYGKYLWTHQAGDNVTVDGYRFKFKDADSHRARVGGKLTADVLPQLQPYVGAAYEYEFSGRIKGSLYGMNLDKPSLRGGTGIGELGLVWTPTESGNFKVDLGAQGYVGKREGVSGGLTVTMSF